MRTYMAWILLGGMLPATLLSGVELPAPLRPVKPELLPLGQSTLHWFGLHVYDIALYCQAPPYTTDGTAALSIRYNIPIKHSRLLETTRKELKRLKKGAEAQHAGWLKQLDSLWPDLRSGDSLTAFKQRGGPTQFYLGQRLLGEVPDPAFGPAFFAIWLDANCLYPEVRDGLLGAKESKKKGR